MSSSQPRNAGKGAPVGPNSDQNDLERLLESANLLEFLTPLQTTRGVRNIRDMGKLSEKDLVSGLTRWAIMAKLLGKALQSCTHNSCIRLNRRRLMLLACLSFSTVKTSRYHRSGLQ
eukprot:6947149-Pyramimonas_sp.AAC.4